MPEAAQTPDNATDSGETGTETEAEKVTDWEAEARKWMKRSKDNYSKLKDAEPKLAEYEKLRAAQQTEAERLAEETTRWQTEAEKWRGASVASRIEVLAAGRFADPTDAVTALGDHTRYLGVDGQINDDVIKTDLDEILQRKPHWAVGATTTQTDTTPRAPWFNPAQAAGASGYGNGTSTTNSGTAATPADQFAAVIQRALQ